MARSVHTVSCARVLVPLVALVALSAVGQRMEEDAAEEVDLGLIFAGVAEGNAAAQLQLAIIYEYGAFGVERDRAKAVEYLRAVIAKHNGLEARVLLANILTLAPRDGIAQDTRESFRLYSEAAAEGFLDAILALGYAYLRGIGTLPSATAAAEAFREAARAGSSMAKLELAALYYEGLGVEQSYRKAAKLFRAAADDGIAEAQWRLAELYGSGMGVKADPNKRFEMLLLASDQHHEDATYELAGMLLDMGHEESAAVVLEENAYRGHVDSQFQLGLMYEHGVGVKKDMLLAFEWLERAARDGDPTAKYSLARFYEEGIVVEKNKRIAIRLRREAEAAASEQEAHSVAKDEEREARWDSMSYKEMLAELEDAIKRDLLHEMGTI